MARVGAAYAARAPFRTTSCLLVAFVAVLAPMACGRNAAGGVGGTRGAGLQGSPFGIFYGLTTYKGRPTTKYMTELGADWTRQTLDWQVVEPTRGQFKWGLVDGAVAILDGAQQAGHPIGILVTLRARSSWATARAGKGRQASAPPADMQDYYRFVNATVKRARGRIHYWQIENEVEYQIFWQGTAEQYLELLRTGYRAVKDADPSAQVVLAGIGDLAWLTPMVRDEVVVGKGNQALAQYNEWAAGNNSPQAKQRPANPQQLLAGVRRYDKMSEFTHRLLQADAARFFDVVDLHAYHPYTLIPAGVRWVQAVMARQGYSKPIWITETSGPKYPDLWPNDQVGERRQAEEVIKRYVLGIASGAERVFWYVLAAPAHQQTGEWSHTGLLRPNLSERPSYSTYRLMTGMLKGASSVRELNLGEGIQAFEFAQPTAGGLRTPPLQGPLYVLWCDKGTTVKLPVGPCRVNITDAFGRQTTQETAEKDLELTLSSTPIFARREGL